MVFSQIEKLYHIKRDSYFFFVGPNFLKNLGPSFSISPPGTDILDFPEKVKITIPNCTQKVNEEGQKKKILIFLRKLSEAEPYAPGIGNDILGPRYV